jgi:hypothetical protein
MHILNENPLNPKGAFCEYERFQPNLSAGRITADERSRKLSMVVMSEVKQWQIFAVNFETIIDCRECENSPGRFDGCQLFPYTVNCLCLHSRLVPVCHFFHMCLIAIILIQHEQWCVIFPSILDRQLSHSRLPWCHFLHPCFIVIHLIQSCVQTRPHSAQSPLQPTNQLSHPFSTTKHALKFHRTHNLRYFPTRPCQKLTISVHIHLSIKSVYLNFSLPHSSPSRNLLFANSIAACFCPRISDKRPHNSMPIPNIPNSLHSIPRWTTVRGTIWTEKDRQRDPQFNSQIPCVEGLKVILAVYQINPTKRKNGS